MIAIGLGVLLLTLAILCVAGIGIVDSRDPDVSLARPGRPAPSEVSRAAARGALRLSRTR